VLDVTHF